LLWLLLLVKEPCLKNKYSLVGSIIGIVLVLDQLTKHYIETHFRVYETVPVISGYFNLTHARNRGAAFSLFADASPVFRKLFFVTVTLVALAVLAVLIKKAGERLLIVSFSLIMAGAAGNLIDRIRYGEVVDFIQWYYRSFYWPSFNVADSAISVGVALLAIDMVFFADKESGKNTKS
jgi:signal peptidase II